MSDDTQAMWVVFRDPLTPFNHLDKHVFELVEDEDIAAYQSQMATTLGGRCHEIHTDVYFLQELFTSTNDVIYFARKYNSWIPRTLEPSR